MLEVPYIVHTYERLRVDSSGAPAMARVVY